MSVAASETSGPKIPNEKEKEESVASKETSEEEIFKEEKVERVESLKDDLREAANSVLQNVIDKIDEKIEKRVEIAEKKNIDFENPTVAEQTCVEKKVLPVGSEKTTKPNSEVEDKTSILPAAQSSNAQNEKNDYPETIAEKAVEIKEAPNADKADKETSRPQIKVENTTEKDISVTMEPHKVQENDILNETVKETKQIDDKETVDIMKENDPVVVDDKQLPPKEPIEEVESDSGEKDASNSPSPPRDQPQKVMEEKEAVKDTMDNDILNETIKETIEEVESESGMKEVSNTTSPLGDQHDEIQPKKVVEESVQDTKENDTLNETVKETKQSVDSETVDIMKESDPVVVDAIKDDKQLPPKAPIEEVESESEEKDASNSTSAIVDAIKDDKPLPPKAPIEEVESESGEKDASNFSSSLGDQDDKREPQKVMDEKEAKKDDILNEKEAVKDTKENDVLNETFKETKQIVDSETVNIIKESDPVVVDAIKDDEPLPPKAPIAEVESESEEKDALNSTSVVVAAIKDDKPLPPKAPIAEVESESCEKDTSSPLEDQDFNKTNEDQVSDDVEETIQNESVEETICVSNEAMEEGEPKSSPKDNDEEENIPLNDGKSAPEIQIEENDVQIESACQQENQEEVSDCISPPVPAGPDEQAEERNSDVEIEEGEIPFIDEKDGILEDSLMESIEEAPLAVDDTKSTEQIEEKETAQEDAKEETKGDVATVEVVETEIVNEETADTAEGQTLSEEEPNASDVTEEDCQAEKQLPGPGKISRKLILVGALFAFIAGLIALSLLDVSAIARSIKFAKPEPKPEPKPFWKIF